MKHYLNTVEETFSNVESSAKGLSSADAKRRLERDGRNKLDEGKKESLVVRFFKQFADPMIIILLVAAGISAMTSMFNGEFPSDVIIILFVVIVNATLGVYQENKAEKAIEALQEMSAATSKVLRDGRVVHVKSEELAVGDVILLEAGDAVPADARVIESASLKMEEAALTGESVPVNKFIDIINLGESKDIPLGDRKNMAYMGSSVVYGRGRAVIVATGMNTEMGKIAGALQQAEDGQTPLQKKLAGLSKVLSIAVIAICVFIFLFGIVRNFVTGKDVNFDFVLNTFMIAVSLAVAAIPEGLVAVVTIVLSIGVTTMSKRNAIIRRLTAVETLGCAQIICSDKTGTLTQNKMTVVETFSDAEGLLAKGFALCTDVSVDADGNIEGEPTEAALVAYALSKDLNKNDIEAKMPRVAEVPFDSMRKMMTTFHKTENGVIQFTKGAPDVVLSRCTKILRNGQVTDITDADIKQITSQNKAFADKALRVLALSYNRFEEVPTFDKPEDIESDLIFCGLAGMIDPVRPEVKDAIIECRNAGIRPIMITGDHRDTAVAIAMELGIINDPDEAITGAELDEISDEDFDISVEHFSVYARVQPEHKTRIVNAWRKRGMITAMTGDGVNDAPSIKSADIGIGMGITGTDVTKNVADMVLADDNFATIVSAVEEGRRIYDNIKKAIQFLLGSNMSEVLSIFFANIFGFTILEPTHLLWINLVTDCFPALALAMEKGESDLMRRQPRKSTDGIFAGGVGIDVIYQGFLVTVLTITAYFLGVMMAAGRVMSLQSVFAVSDTMNAVLHRNGMTMAFLTMSMCEIFHSFNMRSQRGSVIKMAFKGNHNKYLFLAMLGSLVLTTTVIYVPFLARAFDFAQIDELEYATSLGLAFLIIPLVEIVKAFQRLNTKRKQKKAR